MSALSLYSSWEKTNDGTPEEIATFGALGIRFGEVALTELSDSTVNRVRAEPFLPAYNLAEWLAWNWWRLRWEPRSGQSDWSFSHRTSTIGGGYVWPNVTIFSDGERVALIAKPAGERNETLFRYISDVSVIVPAGHFEGAVATFVEQVLSQLNAEGVRASNLQDIWSDLALERSDAHLRRVRRLEALSGFEPDEADDAIVRRLLDEDEALGSESVDEIAAHMAVSGMETRANQLLELANANGKAIELSNYRLASSHRLPKIGSIAAWKLGVAAAKALRHDIGNTEGPLDNHSLASIFSAKSDLVEEHVNAPFAYAARSPSNRNDKLILRSKWITGRRFELARLIGDNAINFVGKVLPATRSNTYRQKTQRAFAAELLAPFEAIMGALSGDYSTENQEDVAGVFEVSPLTIDTTLKNHGIIDRDEDWGDYEGVAALSA